ncbi:MAG TPA: hypothetical protein VGC21_08910 [Telluria sp.]|jgi:hypothetical protein
MKRMHTAALLFLLAGCAGAPPPAAPLTQDRLTVTVVPGQASTASVRAALGPAHSQQFDNGYQVWDYQVARGAGRYAEFVILFGPDGVVRKTRLREPPAGHAGAIP